MVYVLGSSSTPNQGCGGGQVGGQRSAGPGQDHPALGRAAPAILLTYGDLAELLSETIILLLKILQKPPACTTAMRHPRTAQSHPTRLPDCPWFPELPCLEGCALNLPACPGSQHSPRHEMHPSPYQCSSFRIPKARGPTWVGPRQLRACASVSHRPPSEELNTGELQGDPRERNYPPSPKTPFQAWLRDCPGPSAEGAQPRTSFSPRGFQGHPGAASLQATSSGSLWLPVGHARASSEENSCPPRLPSCIPGA